MEVCDIFLNVCKELYTYTCNITKKLSFLVEILCIVTHTLIDNKSISCITLPQLLAYPVRSVARSHI